jgi:hypothetical protein
MPDPILKIDLTGGPELVDALQRKGPRVLQVLATKLSGLMLMLESKVKMKLSGQVLKVRTGVLRASVHAIPVQVQGNTIVGAIESSGGPAMYGRFLEYGSRPHEIFAVKARALRFVVGGKVRFAKMVAHPGTAPHSFMQSSLNESADSIRTALQAALNKVIAE